MDPTPAATAAAAASSPVLRVHTEGLATTQSQCASSTPGSASASPKQPLKSPTAEEQKPILMPKPMAI